MHHLRNCSFVIITDRDLYIALAHDWSQTVGYFFAGQILFEKFDELLYVQFILGEADREVKLFGICILKYLLDETLVGGDAETDQRRCHFFERDILFIWSIDYVKELFGEDQLIDLVNWPSNWVLMLRHPFLKRAHAQVNRLRFA